MVFRFWEHFKCWTPVQLKLSFLITRDDDDIEKMGCKTDAALR